LYAAFLRSQDVFSKDYISPNRMQRNVPNIYLFSQLEFEFDLQIVDLLQAKSESSSKVGRVVFNIHEAQANEEFIILYINTSVLHLFKDN
jgi:hypothetical protein